MSPCSCREQTLRLSQQVTVMRREIKNLRQQLEGAVRSHRKLMASLQSEVEVWSRGEPPPRPGAPGPQQGAEVSLEEGRIQTTPVGYIQSCFPSKIGTPRQPGVCASSRARLQIQPSIFTNPDHALSGLEGYSHVWIIFLFHKNGHLSYKAKVKPPRLNGQKVGVYSTRSPHRPNAIGLTLTKLEGITGDTLHLSGVDLISGTPVLDIKPYIPDYDSPSMRNRVEMEVHEPTVGSDPEPEGLQLSAEAEPEAEPEGLQLSAEAEPEAEPKGLQLSAEAEPEAEPEGLQLSAEAEPEAEPEGLQLSAPERLSSPGPSQTSESGGSRVLEEVRAYLLQEEPSAESSAEEGPGEPEPEREDPFRLCYGAEAFSRIASWIRDPPLPKLRVRFTPTAQRQLHQFLPPDSTESGRPKFRFLKGPEEASAALRSVLAADPRSVYRRTRCLDRLFFLSLDTADVTCWFGDGFVEVLQVRPVRTLEDRLGI